MALYSSIFTRKSTRKFTDQPLSGEALADIKSFIQTIPPLVPDAEITYKIVGPEEVKGMGIPKAPHYFLIYGKEQFLRNTCAGFLFQHVDLYLFSKGYAEAERSRSEFHHWDGLWVSRKGREANINGF